MSLRIRTPQPTNHLDLDAIEAIENALKLYQGAILAVSHDESFLNNIAINQMIILNEKKCLVQKIDI